MADLSALTAHTGDEFALFTKGKDRLIIRGNSLMVNLDIEQAKKTCSSWLSLEWSYAPRDRYKRYDAVNR